ncbi:hypothetical protein [Thermococcus sp.]
MRGQISLDFLFAVTLIAILSLNLVYLGSSQKTQAETFDLTTKAKVFAISVRDSVAKVYAMGDGFKVNKTLPFTLGPGDSVVVTLDNRTNSVIVSGSVGGKAFYISQKSQVPIYYKSQVVLNETMESFWIIASYNSTEGRLYVEVSP